MQKLSDYACTLTLAREFTSATLVTHAWASRALSKLPATGTVIIIDNHSSGYLGMAVEHCVRAYLGPHCILAQKQYCQKLMAQLNSTAFFTPVCVF